MKLWQAFRDGIRMATRVPAPLIVMSLVSLVAALMLTVPVYTAMETWIGHRVIARDLARDWDLWLVLEPLMRNALQPSGVGVSHDPAATVFLAMTMTVLLAWLASPLPNVLLGGGVLLTYVEGRFSWRRFLWGAWHWMLSFFALSILFAVGTTLVAALGGMALAVLGSGRSDALTTLGWVVVGLIYAVMSAAFDYARVIAVADGTRNFIRVLGQAAVFIVRQPLPSLGLYLLMTALGLALIPFYARAVAPIIPFEWAFVAIAMQQLFIIVRLWTRLARWAGEAVLYRRGELAQTAVSGDN
jgi:hypothetical protein